MPKDKLRDRYGDCYDRFDADSNGYLTDPYHDRVGPPDLYGFEVLYRARMDAQYAEDDALLS